MPDDFKNNDRKIKLSEVVDAISDDIKEKARKAVTIEQATDVMAPFYEKRRKQENEITLQSALHGAQSALNQKGGIPEFKADSFGDLVDSAVKAAQVVGTVVSGLNTGVQEAKNYMTSNEPPTILHGRDVIPEVRAISKAIDSALTPKKTINFEQYETTKVVAPQLPSPLEMKDKDRGLKKPGSKNGL